MPATMTAYEFTVRDRNGRLVEGKVSAENEGVLRERLMSMGSLPLDIREANKGMQREIRIGLPKRVKLKDLAVVARQFATMLGAGMTMLRTISILAEQSDNDELKRVLNVVYNDVQGGDALSAALEKHPAVFPPLMTKSVKAGEVQGGLDATMLELAKAFEEEVKLRAKIKAALTYPAVIFALAILMCVAMLLFIVPTFAKMFADLGGQLPLPTRILVAMSDGLKVGGPFALIGLIGGVFWWRRNQHKPAIRRVIDPLKLRLPIFGNLFQKVALARFCRTFSTLIRAGVPMLTALDIVADTSGSVVIAAAVRDVQQSVSEGETVSGPLGDHDVFPPMLVNMMAVGEEAGELDTMLTKIGESYDQEVETTTEQLTSIIEPLMIAVLGGIVGSMIIALYMPIFKIFDLIG